MTEGADPACPTARAPWSARIFGQPGGMAPPQKPQALHGLLRKLKQGGLAGRPPAHAPTPVPNGPQFAALAFSSEDGSRPYKLYTPSRYRDEPVPLVVMLHGCTQSPDDFAAFIRSQAEVRRKVIEAVGLKLD